MDVSFVFSPSVRVEFLQYIHQNPNSRRVSQTERELLIEHITSTVSQPANQRESSRRHYVRKNFIWDAEGGSLRAVPKGTQTKDREVVTMDNIVGVVEAVHRSNAHAGWDATWREVSSSFYGILRADVIFLLKRCPVCARDPRKRPKSHLPTMDQLDDAERHTECPNTLNDLLQDDLFLDIMRSDDASSK